MTHLAVTTTFAVAAGVSWASIYAIRAWTTRKRILDHPTERSSHSRPTPRGGGIAIVAITLIGLSIFSFWNSFSDGKQLGAFVAASLAIALISWLDDLYGVQTYLRLAIHTMAAIVTVGLFGWWGSVWIPLAGSVSLGWFGVILTLVWIVGLTNAYNFMDGIDGIAGAQAIVAGLGWGWLGLQIGKPDVAAFGMLIAGSSAGFLIHNWQPAKIFMGDVGSAFLGFALALITVAASKEQEQLASCGVLLVWPFVFDTMFTFVRRLRRGDRVFRAHRSHLYQRLTQTGMTHAQVSALYASLAAAGLICAILIQRGAARADMLTVVVIVSLSAALWITTVRRERHQGRWADEAHP